MLKTGIGKVLIFILIACSVSSYGSIEAAPSCPVMNTYTILNDNWLPSDVMPYQRNYLTKGIGVFNVAIFSEKVTKDSPLYKIFSRLPMSSQHKKALLENITDGVLKIYCDLGADYSVWNNNRRVFESELESYKVKALCKPPDFVIITHNHLPNYVGGLRAMQENYPQVPVFITEDMKEGFVYFDESSMVGKRIKVKTPVVVRSGETVLTDRLSIITAKFKKQWENMLLNVDYGIVRRGYKSGYEYENILKVKTRGGFALFTSCLHSSFPNDRRNVLYCGGMCGILKDDEINEAVKISPSLHFYLFHCGLPKYYSMQNATRIGLGQSIFLDM